MERRQFTREFKLAYVIPSRHPNTDRVFGTHKARGYRFLAREKLTAPCELARKYAANARSW
jgi:hypothetical protein